LCTLANNTLDDNLSIFLSNELISKRAQSREVIETQMKAAIDHFQLSTPQMFNRMLNFIREIAQGNGLLSSIDSNWYVLPMKRNEYYGLLYPRSYGTNNCSCGPNAMCTSSAAINRWNVPGFFVGCDPLESLLQSTLQCLYDLRCINNLKKTNIPSNIIIRPLDSTLSSPNVTVKSLVDKLMVDRWESSVNYEHYYAACATRSCIYSVTERANIIYTITTIIGFYGGLSVAFRIIAPVLVKIAQYLIRCRRQRIEPTVAAISGQE
jgi:hypothetical protein